MTLRLDGLYDTMAELEERIEDTKILKNSAQMRLITIDNIKKILDSSNPDDYTAGFPMHPHRGIFSKQSYTKNVSCQQILLFLFVLAC